MHEERLTKSQDAHPEENAVYMTQKCHTMCTFTFITNNPVCEFHVPESC